MGADELVGDVAPLLSNYSMDAPVFHLHRKTNAGHLTFLAGLGNTLPFNVKKITNPSPD